MDNEKVIDSDISKSQQDLPVYREAGRAIGVCFEHVTVVGVAAGENTVLDFGAVLQNLVSFPINLVRQFAGNRKSAVRDLIHDVSGVVPAGEMLLVLGTPGAGCSTTLRAISSNTESFVRVDGDVSYSSISSGDIQKHYRSEVVFNGENDTHFPSLTVGNTMDFALKLRKPAKEKESTKKFSSEMSNKLLKSFNISHTVKTVVGNAFVRGVSGGERKRISLAEVLATNPAVACWDQPNRGLDSSSALDFFRMLKAMSRRTGMANIVTMYQTAESIYEECFDRVLVLYQGRMIYYGRTEQARRYFIEMGYHCEPRQTTPDFLTCVTSVTERSVRADHVGPVPQTPEDFVRYFESSTSFAAMTHDIAAYKAEHNAHPNHAEEFRREAQRIRSSATTKTSPQPHSLVSQVGASIRRHYALVWGDKTSLFTLLFLNIVNAVITGSCFYMAPRTATGAYERGGAIFFSLIYFFLNALNETPSTVMSRAIVIKQSKLGILQPAALVIAQTIADIPLQVVHTLVFSCCYYFMLGLNRTASQFWIFELINFVHLGAVSALFRMLGAIAPNLNLALLMAGATIPIGLTYSGFAPPGPTMLGWGEWIRRITPSPYALEALMGNEFFDIDLACTDTQLVPNGPGYGNIRYQGCSLPGATPGSAVVPGATYLEIVYSFTRSHLWRNFGIILVFWFLYTVFATIGLSYTARETGGAGGHIFKRGAKPSEALVSTQIDVEDLEKQPSRTIHALAATASTNTSQTQLTHILTTPARPSPGSVFTFENVCYYVKVGGEERQLLRNVSGYARPGQLTALMGSSGAGKTTLLDTIAQRKSEGRVEGRMLVNGQPLDGSFGRSCAFCLQQDVHEPNQTVREAFQFSANLRQSADISTAEKMEYVEHIISLLELEPIADAIIGEGETGLGVEERKRVTIGVELAARPSALFFLDEPTSGLDSQAAYSIVYFLRKIAAEGLPVICTIHQPNGVLFEMFDHVLLLGPGGRTIYFGETGTNAEEVAKYFGRQGAHIQSHENPAEFMISTISGPGISEKWHEYWLQSAERAELETKISEINADPAVPMIESSTSGSRQYALPLWAQIMALTRRHWISTYRDGSYNFSKTFKSLFCEMFNAFTFFSIGNDLQGIQNYVLSLLILVQVIPALAPDIQAKWLSKWALFDARERNGIYDYKALTAALIIVEIPWQLLNFTLMYFVSYWTVGWPDTSYSAGYSFVLWLVLSYFATSWSQLIASIFPGQTVGLANSLFWNILIIFSGVLVPQASLNIFYRNWLWWLDPFRWFLGGHVATTLHNVRVECAPKDLAIFNPPSGQTCGEYAASFLSTATGYLVDPAATANCGYCPYTVGDQYAATMNFFASERWRDWGLCIVFCVSNTILIFAVMWFTKARGRGVRSA